MAVRRAAAAVLLRPGQARVACVVDLAAPLRAGLRGQVRREPRLQLGAEGGLVRRDRADPLRPTLQRCGAPFRARGAGGRRPGRRRVRARTRRDSADGERIEFDPAYAEAGRAIWRPGSSARPRPSRRGSSTSSRTRAKAGMLPRRLHRRARAGAARARLGRAARALPAAAARDGLRPLRARRAVPDRAARRLGRGREPRRGRAGRRRVADQRREVVLLAWRTPTSSSSRRGGAARPRARAGSAAFSCRAGSTARQRVPDPAAEGQARHARARDRRDRVRGALGYAIGAPEEGFRIAAATILNTSRWLNALGSTGLMRRAYLEAARVRARADRVRAARRRLPARAREPRRDEGRGAGRARFDARVDLPRRPDRPRRGDRRGRRLAPDPRQREQVRHLAGRRRAPCAAGSRRSAATAPIEDFSPLPRLYRDAIVFESWEGTHNVLCAQVLRDLSRLEHGVDLVLERVARA